MNEFVGHILNVLFGFFAIMNPIANTAVFLGLTSGVDAIQKRKIAIKALSIAFGVVVTFSLLGNLIFHVFGISLPALRVTGGVLVFLIGYNMLNGERSKMHKPRGQDESEDDDSDIAISPLAVPILAGPGTIATSINFSSSGSWSAVLVTIGTFAVLCGVTFFCFIFGEKIVGVLGKGGLNIVTRLMGLILAVVGVQMLMEGIVGAIKLFGSEIPAT
jgi:multiple antibiotic resistance protein